MSDPVLSKYRLYDSTAQEWIIYYFKTIASQVVETNQKQFVSGNIKVNNKSFAIASGQTYFSLTLNGSEIVGNAESPSQDYTLQKITANDTIASALGKLDKAAFDALNSIPSGVITTSNWLTSLQTIYSWTNNQKAQADTVLGILWQLVNSGDGVIGWYDTGFTKYTDLTAFVDLTGKLDNGISVNGVTINNSNKNATIYGSNIALNSSDSTKVDEAIYALQSQVQGAVTGYSIQTSGVTPTSTYANNQFADDAQNLQISWGVSGQPTKIKDTSGHDILLKDLKVGDDIYLEDSNYPDRWVSAKTGTSAAGQLTFSIRVEARQPWSSITGKPSSCAAMISDLNWNDLGINTSTRVITIGGNTITPLTSFSVPSATPSLTWGSTVTIFTLQGTAIKVTMPSQPTDTKNSVGGDNTTNKIFLVGLTAQTTNNGNGRGYTNSQVYAQNGCIYSRGAAVNKVTVGASAPSNPLALDLWLDTSAA